MNTRQVAFLLFASLLFVSGGWIFFFTEFMVTPVLVERKIQLFTSSEPQTSWPFNSFYTKAVDFTRTDNQTRFGVGGSYVLNRRVDNGSLVIVEKYQVPLRVGGRSYVEVYEAEGPTLDGKIMKGQLLASTPDYGKTLYLAAGIFALGLFSLILYSIKRMSRLDKDEENH